MFADQQKKLEQRKRQCHHIHSGNKITSHLKIYHSKIMSAMSVTIRLTGYGWLTVMVISWENRHCSLVTHSCFPRNILKALWACQDANRLRHFFRYGLLWNIFIFSICSFQTSTCLRGEWCAEDQWRWQFDPQPGSISRRYSRSLWVVGKSTMFAVRRPKMWASSLLFPGMYKCSKLTQAIQ